MGLVTALEVAEPAWGPDLVETPLVDERLDHLVLTGRLDGHEVHADLATKVPGIQPAHLMTLEKEKKGKL